MQLMTSSLPSGLSYDIPGVRVNPMTFAQTLEYLESVPKDPVERYYFEYCLVKQDDPNIDKLNLVDFEYVRFIKKAITISTNEQLSTTITCPRCGTKFPIKFHISDMKFSPIEDDVKQGLSVMFHGHLRKVRIPSMEVFMKIFSKYRYYRKLTNLRLIKLISLFEDAETYHQVIETQVVRSTHKDITILAMLEDIFLDIIKPLQATCMNCVDSFSPTTEQLESLTEGELEELKTKAGGISVGINSLAENFFRDILNNNPITGEEIHLGSL